MTHTPRGILRAPFLALLAESLEVLTTDRPTDVALCELAERVYVSLQHHPARGVVLGWPVAYLGAKDRYLGGAAFASGRPEQALKHFQRSLTRDAQSPTLQAKNQLSMARAHRRMQNDAAAHQAANKAHRLADRLGLASIAEDSARIASR